ncbi:MAG: hypothetical protein R3C68_02720 [Myxococcota bacterium]
MANIAIEPRLENESGVVHRGDILEILSEPEDVDTCVALGPDGQPQRLAQLYRPFNGSLGCLYLERRIVEVVRVPGEPTRLLLSEPLDPTCFLPGGAINYRLRSGDKFLVSSGSVYVERMRPGDLFGPGSPIGFDPRLFFRLNPFEVQGDLPAYERYGVDGRPLVGNGMSDVLIRASGASERLAFRITDPFSRLQVGLIDRGVGAEPAGRLPGALLVTPAQEGVLPTVFVSYTSNDAILAIRPYKTAQISTSSNTLSLVR